MSASNDSFLAQWLLTRKYIDHISLKRAQAHQQAKMSQASLAQVLLALGIVSQDIIAQAAKLLEISQKDVIRPVDMLSESNRESRRMADEIKAVVADLKKAMEA